MAKRYLLDREAFLDAGGLIILDRPMLQDLTDQAGSASGHYFHQDLLVATKINLANPIKHVDVGSRIDGFVAHVASFRDIEVFDIRPLSPTAHTRIKFIQGDLMSQDKVPVDYCDSLSCLHALEHFGLGRYGDPIAPEGHRKGFDNLTRMLKPGGMLYISFPIGSNETIGTHFNAHRVFDPTEILAWSGDTFTLVDYSYVDDNGDLHLDKTPAQTPALKYGCGIFTLMKNQTTSGNRYHEA
ncbi:DUF268 domain-containing protein [Aquabacterium sp. G14]|uniref:DUF268 domain-containing protein n=1 Tax=Aquabacterium sp. G14 TaxID=3130164 RepID=UPI0030A5BDFB